MTMTKEDRLQSDLGEITATLEGDLAEVTPDEVFQQMLAQVKARCEGASAALRNARALYDADVVENKVVALEYAQAMLGAVQEVLALEEEIRARALSRRALDGVAQVEQVKRQGWMDSAFPKRPSWWERASQKDSLDALMEIQARVNEAGSLATAQEVEVLAEVTAQAKTTYEALVRERLDDKPISEALKSAMLRANAHRSGARAMIQGLLTMEGSDLTLAAFLKRRAKRKPTQASADSATPTDSTDA
jgi:hypothetical protein